MKIYYFRHQAAGILTAYPFSQVPSERQVAALERLCFQAHGFGHPKTPDVPYWTRIVEVDALGPDDVPEVPERNLSAVNAAGLSQITVTGSGTVSPRGV